MMTPEFRNQDYYEQLKAQAKQTDIVDWVTQHAPNIQLRRVGHYYEIVGHDSVRIKGNKYWRNSQSNLARNPIDFLVEFCGMSGKDAMVALTGVDLTGRGGAVPRPKPKANAEKKKIILPPDVATAREFDFSSIELDQSQERVVSYLTGKRGIAEALVRGEIDNKRVFQEAGTGNAIFTMCDANGAIVGAEVCGTINSAKYRFKGIKSGSKYGYGYNVGERAEPRFILYFESAIDLLSFITIKQAQQKPLTGCLFVSLAGLKAAIMLRTMEVFGQASARPVFCVDNDNAGDKFIEDYFGQYPNALVRRPDKDYKDWNDQLLGKRKLEAIFNDLL